MLPYYRLLSPKLNEVEDIRTLLPTKKVLSCVPALYCFSPNALSLQPNHLP